MTSTDTTTARPTTACIDPELRYDAYRVIAKKDAPDQWLKIGVAEVHKDGLGFSLYLEALPLDGKVICRRRYPDAETEDLPIRARA